MDLIQQIKTNVLSQTDNLITMNSIVFIEAKNKSQKIKFINILKKITNLEATQLSEKYNDLLNSKPVLIEFSVSNIDEINDAVGEIMEMDVSIGDSSFHEENIDDD